MTMGYYSKANLKLTVACGVMGLMLNFGVAHALPGNTLVLLDTLATKQTHSDFFSLLTARGYKLTFKQADDSALSLKKYGEYLYKHLILFSPTTEEFGGNINTQALTEFIDDGGNVLAAVNSRVGEAMKDLAAECGLEVDNEGAAVIDHLSFDEHLDTGDHTTIVADPAKQLADIFPMLGGTASKDFPPILFKGIGLITNSNNPLVTNVLRGSASTFSSTPGAVVRNHSPPNAIGESASLIASLQARNNARVLFSGSLLFFSNEYLRATVSGSSGAKAVQSGNKRLAEALAAWAFRETGVLRHSDITHGGPYTIMDEATFSMKVETLNPKGEWVPYSYPAIQMEFVRIDPFVRTDLRLIDARQGRYEASFRVPDVYGVFQFRVEHRRPGFDRLEVASQVSVHPLQHTQYERFIPAARPYVLSALMMMLGLFVFSFVFIHQQDNDKDDKEKKPKKE
ncbi:dolichyl-diphosphooligosaccharide--protein glycosyltransferase 48 kDa subunit-like [Tropilaelaps mercedesae]|uniref:Dolichyl-diphosphooligosaccharide--protein glycosyltransferase 48 kDa subunit n=1 Tax=Tropilaelaps mercedesae TaxID=418985 RepID=A0A1V9XSP3_9ACAR|nr:dolichyl-diphosphooligosaccharide--protein glycosyltransferase 48 kDa subunit-like [Tropilaelaps mercedesae]